MMENRRYDEIIGNRVITYLDGHVRRANSLAILGSAPFNAGFNTLIGASGPGDFAGAADIDELGIWSRRLTSWQEYLAGIDPTDPASVLHLRIQHTNATATILLLARSNKT